VSTSSDGMIHDRLGDVRDGTAEANHAPAGDNDDEQFMNTFFEQVNDIKTLMSEIRHNIDKIEANYSAHITAYKGDEVKGIFLLRAKGCCEMLMLLVCVSVKCVVVSVLLHRDRRAIGRIA